MCNILMLMLMLMLMLLLAIAGAIFFGALRMDRAMTRLRTSLAVLNLSGAWNGADMLASRLVVAGIFKQAPPANIDPKQWLAVQDRSEDWLHFAAIAQFMRRLSNARNLGMIDTQALRVEFQGVGWWAERFAIVYGRFPEEASLTRKVQELCREIKGDADLS